MRVRDIFIKHDERRERWRVQPMGWVAAALVAILIASVTSGVWASLAGPQLRVTPTARPAVQATAAPAVSASPTPRPTATSIVHETCPSDPALWTLVPYTLPGSDKTLYAVDPPCVMEQAEQAFLEYLAYRREHGRNWTVQDDERFFSPAGFTAPLSGDVVRETPGLTVIFCSEVVNPDGTPVEYDAYVVFYTIAISEEGQVVADVLYVSRPLGPFIRRSYDCETGELTGEVHNDGTETFVLYQPMLYEDARWRLGERYDVYHYVPSDQIDPQAMIGVILNAQGRDGP